MKQKFKIMQFIKVDDEMPETMRHFRSGFVGIVSGTYSQQYGGCNIESYSIYRTDGDKVVGRTSWYNESQLTLCDEQDIDKAYDMVEVYNTRRI